MPRYFLNVRDDATFTEDLDGSDLPNLQAVRTEAVAAARELLSEAILNGFLPLDRRFEVADDQGQTVLVVPFVEAVQQPGWNADRAS